MKKLQLLSLILMTFVGFSGQTIAQDVLPFPPVPSASTAGITIEESTYKNREVPNHLPEDAPNIVIIMIDDVGPGQAGTFGGEFQTPTLSKIANEGISYNRFHSTAMCTPTRAALLTGRN
ncbi:MAG: sulfatase-like hydrolase/transferase, partial [Bacteroidales bacterium]